MAMLTISDLLIWTMIAGLGLAGIVFILIWIKDKTKKVSYLRLFVQILSNFAIFYMIIYEKRLGLVLAVVLLITFVVGRFFCGWICPFGFYMDLVSLLRNFFKTRYHNLPERLNRFLHRLRYVILAVFFILPFVMGPLYPQSWILAVFLRGPFDPLRILLGPLVPIIVPWGGPLTFNGLNFNYPYMDQIVYYSSGDFVLINVFVFIGLTVVSSFFVRRFWCRFCPTGASLAIINRFKGFERVPALYIDKDEEKCTKCGICKRVCPVQVTDVYEQKGGKITTSMCMLCFRCVEMCPYENCLRIKFAGKTAFKSRNWLEPSESE
jgi:polyferredoxin